jgi:hypothetical protein
MKIQIVKKADRKPSDVGCTWVIEQIAAPGK